METIQTSGAGWSLTLQLQPELERDITVLLKEVQEYVIMLYQDRTDSGIPCMSVKKP